MNKREAGFGVAMCGIFAAFLVALDSLGILDGKTGVEGTGAFIGLVLTAFLLSFGATFAVSATFRRRQEAAADIRTPVDHQGASAADAGSSLSRRIAVLEERNRALKCSEQRYRDWVEAASDRFWELDAELRYRYVSEPAGTRFQPDANSIIGKRRWEVIGADPETDPSWALHKAEMEAQKPFEDFRYHHPGTDGAKRHWSVSGKPIFDPEGKFLGYRGWSKDITKAVEQEQAIKAAAKDAEIANSAKSEFLANMSHELRTPLNAIIGFSQIIKDNTLGPNSPKYRNYAADIHECGQHLLELINDILDLAKIESGKEDLLEHPVDIAEVIAACGRIVQARAMERKIALVYELQGDMPSIVGDARKLRQILVNLLSNAVKFSDEGGMVTIRTRCDAEEGFAMEVEDRGIGMAPEDIPRALSLFGQLDSDANRIYEGTGLGLPLTKALAEQHGGSLELESEPGEGTTATIRLPAERLIVPTPAAEQSAIG